MRLQVIGDLFTAGMETIKTTLEWTVVYMLRNPRVAKAVQEELDQVVGRNRLPTLRDREFLPYTEATILEVLRISSVVPLGSTHAVTRYVCSFREEGRFERTILRRVVNEVFSFYIRFFKKTAICPKTFVYFVCLEINKMVNIWLFPKNNMFVILCV